MWFIKGSARTSHRRKEGVTLQLLPDYLVLRGTKLKNEINFNFYIKFSNYKGQAPQPPYCSCHKVNDKSAQIYPLTVLEVRSLKRVSRAMFLLAAPGENPVFCPFQIPELTCILWIVVPFLHFQNQPWSIFKSLSLGFCYHISFWLILTPPVSLLEEHLWLHGAPLDNPGQSPH